MTKFGELEWVGGLEQQDSPVCQNSAYGGNYEVSSVKGVQRTISGFSKDMKTNQSLSLVIRQFMKVWRIPIDSNVMVNVHISGLHNNRDKESLQERRRVSIADQGIHQDGSLRLGIFIIDRKNVKGIFNSLYEDEAGKIVVLPLTQLNPNEGLYFHDTALYHYVSPPDINMETSEGMDFQRTVVFCHWPGDMFRLGSLRDAMYD